MESFAGSALFDTRGMFCWVPQQATPENALQILCQTTSSEESGHAFFHHDHAVFDAGGSAS